ncbi:MAG: hypothetical protein N2254_09750 [bacterium]|nr:hypothetical protein [bacterium]
MEFPINPDFPTNFQPHIEIFSIRYFDESVKKYISTGQDEKYYIISPRMIMGDSFSQYPVARIVYGKPEFGKVEFYLPQVAVEHTAVNDDSERAEGYVPLG